MKSPGTCVSECKFWEYLGLCILFFFATMAIIVQFKDWSITRDIVIACGATIGITWSIWVVRTFRHILEWWVGLHVSLQNITNLLNETKKELKEIKSDLK